MATQQQHLKLNENVTFYSMLLGMLTTVFLTSNPLLSKMPPSFFLYAPCIMYTLFSEEDVGILNIMVSIYFCKKFCRNRSYPNVMTRPHFEAEQKIIDYQICKSCRHLTNYHHFYDQAMYVHHYVCQPQLQQI